jgi:hypothetical protein
VIFSAKGLPHAVSRQHFGCLEVLGPAAAPEATNPFSRRFFGAIEDDGNELLPFTLLADMGNEAVSAPT